MRGMHRSLCEPGRGRPELDRRLRLLDSFLEESESARGRPEFYRMLRRPDFDPVGLVRRITARARPVQAKLSIFHQSFADWLTKPESDAGLEYLHIGDQAGGQLALAVWRLRQLAARGPPGQTATLREAVERVLGNGGAAALPDGGATPEGHFELPAATEPDAAVQLYETCVYLLAARLSPQPARARERCVALIKASGVEMGLAGENGLIALMSAGVRLLLGAGAPAG
jgi:hypothetical protein